MSKVTLTIEMTRPSVDVEYFGDSQSVTPDLQVWLDWIEENATQTITSTPDELTRTTKITMPAEKWDEYIQVATTKTADIANYNETAGIEITLSPVWHD